MTGMFEAYVENPRGFMDRAVICRARVPQAPFRRASYAHPGYPAADPSEHGGRIFIVAPIFEAIRWKGNTPKSQSLTRYSFWMPFLKMFR